MDHQPIPASRYTIESRVANSRFIATIAPAFSVEEAKGFILEINKKYPDATHNVPVYIIGHGSSIVSHSSDNGEPPGTAGRPALSVLKGSGLGDTVLVITRYFGGTKLGTGGLVKAYSDAARDVIAAVPKAEKILVHYVSIQCPYNLFEKIARIIKQHQGEIIEDSFTDTVRLTFTLPINSYKKFQNAINEVSSGRVHPEITESNQIAQLKNK